MAKARSPNRNKAFDIFKEHNGNIANREIAEILNENEKTISNWKCRDNWNVVLQKDKCSTTKKKKGGQKNNKNALKDGIYENIFFNTLTTEEIELIKSENKDEIHRLELEISLLTVREHRHMKRIKQYEEKVDKITLESIDKRTLKIEGNLLKDNEQTQTETVTRAVSIFERVQKLEAELTKIQKEKAKNIERLQKLKMDKEKFEIEKSNLDKENKNKEITVKVVKASGENGK
ncbi:TPA: terminase [Clostridioides difficile]|uniref:phage terminase small subunit n=1 Tax=Clostridioides difficile TaxID=1496 RepID=UPI0009800CA0|nr:phage terminase small subunit [Clostridioides difficile]AXU74643.1 phage-related terminase small subunit-like protein [Clostridioides difficile]EKJ1396048.1 terminase [Clostridioides difficile]MBY2516639.1 terminase [Clostridioides difficile]SJT10572.1 Phage terminase small subunit [Clostridioides difficile]VIB40276.1 phage-related terminase small subunit-like protein [Clostridioides difficile]